MSFEETPVSAWDSRPVVKPSVAEQSAPAAVTAPSSPSSSITSSAPAAVDSDARQAIGELHRLITDIGQQTRAACAELADRVRALELHATNPAGHDAPAPTTPSSPAAAGG